MTASVDDNVTQSDSLYAAQQKIYPREVPGRFRNLRTLTTLVLLGIYYGLVWLKWDGHQAILFDLPARRFYIGALIFVPQDFYLLTWLLIIAALSLFFFTSLAGRLWCGFACPQTVWTDAFVWLERITEGRRSQRMKLDGSPWSLNKLWRKSAKHVLWMVFAIYTGFTFVGYFTPIRQLLNELCHYRAGPWETFWVFFYGFATWGNAGFMREQVCKYMCPYARFQSAMFDKHTLIISYDSARGEPRGSRRRGLGYKAEGLGDCIDCTLCVQACPTGIDIRKGLQYECIACAACIDACDSVMDKMNYPRGLVHYSTQAAQEGMAPHVVRPRTLIYATLWLALVGGFFWAVAHRSMLELDVLRDRNALYREIEPGEHESDQHKPGESESDEQDYLLIENVYTLKIINKDDKTHRYAVTVQGIDDAELIVNDAELTVGPVQVATVTARVRAPQLESGGMQPINFVIEAIDAPQWHASSRSRFFSPE